MAINVLSWNVCFGCKCSDKISSNDKSSQTLPSFCEKLKIERGVNVCLVNVCLLNVSKFIDYSCLDGKSYDFIGLQESANWMEIIRRSSELSKMGLFIILLKLEEKNQTMFPFTIK